VVAPRVGEAHPAPRGVGQDAHQTLGVVVAEDQPVPEPVTDLLEAVGEPIAHDHIVGGWARSGTPKRPPGGGPSPRYWVPWTTGMPSTPLANARAGASGCSRGAARPAEVASSDRYPTPPRTTTSRSSGAASGVEPALSPPLRYLSGARIRSTRRSRCTGGRWTLLVPHSSGGNSRAPPSPPLPLRVFDDGATFVVTGMTAVVQRKYGLSAGAADVLPIGVLLHRGLVPRGEAAILDGAPGLHGQSGYLETMGRLTRPHLVGRSSSMGPHLPWDGSPSTRAAPTRSSSPACSSGQGIVRAPPSDASPAAASDSISCAAPYFLLFGRTCREDLM
jgi:hypothetical protein